MAVLIGLYVACELIANLTAVKPVVLGPLVVPAGVFIYALTFTLLDLVNETLGRAGARQAVAAGVLANALLAGYAQLTVWWPAPGFFDGQAAVARVLGSTPRIVVASLVAYGLSGLLDAELFAWWRARVGGPRWGRVLVSNGLSTLVDSAVFITLAFAGILPVLPLVAGQYVTKMGVTVVSLPLIYVVRRGRPSGTSRAGATATLAALAGLAATLVPAPVLAARSAVPPRLDPGQAPAVSTAATRIEAAVVGLRATVPPGRPSARILGTERFGAGVLIEPDGLVVTVGYLVLEASGLEATLADGRRVPARVVGHDFESGLALVRLSGPGPYAVVPLGTSAALAPGQPVSIVGFAEDHGPLTRNARVDEVRPFVAYWEYRLERAILLGPVHPAFGGAAVVDPEGRLVGLVSLRLAEDHLAIPIELLQPERSALLATGRPARPPRPWLGIRAIAVTEGIAVAGVSPTGPAQVAGLREGDVIVRLEGTPIADLETFYARLWATPMGRPVTLTVARDGGVTTVVVRPADRYGAYQLRAP